jgi:hypothetical protein
MDSDGTLAWTGLIRSGWSNTCSQPKCIATEMTRRTFKERAARATYGTHFLTPYLTPYPATNVNSGDQNSVGRLAQMFRFRDCAGGCESWRTVPKTLPCLTRNQLLCAWMICRHRDEHRSRSLKGTASGFDQVTPLRRRDVKHGPATCTPDTQANHCRVRGPRAGAVHRGSSARACTPAACPDQPHRAVRIVRVGEHLRVGKGLAEGDGAARRITAILPNDEAVTCPYNPAAGDPQAGVSGAEGFLDSELQWRGSEGPVLHAPKPNLTRCSVALLKTDPLRGLKNYPPLLVGWDGLRSSTPTRTTPLRRCHGGRAWQICRQICRRTAENRGAARGNAAHPAVTFELAQRTLAHSRASGNKV